MNCLNGKRFLREALDSVLAQTFRDFEVVFWDNGSTDGTLELVGEYSAIDERIRVLRNPGDTVPLGEARKLAMRACNSDLIAFLDVDDVWQTDTLSRLVGWIEEDSILAGVYAGTTEIDAAGNVLRRRSPASRTGNLLPNLLQDFDVYIPAMIVRRSVLESHDLSFDRTIHASEEVCLWLQMAAICRLASRPDSVARYRVHGGTLTADAIERWALERRYSLKRVKERDPDVETRYPREWKEAQARAHFYQARFYVSQGRRSDAQSEMTIVRFHDPRYFVLYLLTFLPLGIWRWVISGRSGRPEPVSAEVRSFS